MPLIHIVQDERWPDYALAKDVSITLPGWVVNFTDEEISRIAKAVEEYDACQTLICEKLPQD
jgi:hypothetical protein